MNILRILLIVYVILIAPNLPYSISKIVNNPIFRLSILILTIYIANHDFIMSLLIAICLTISINIANNLEHFETPPKINPKCNNITAPLLLKKFGNINKMIKAIHETVYDEEPDIDISDPKMMPRIATILMNKGYITC